MKKLLLTIASSLLLVGCAHNTKELGTVGSVTFYRVSSSRFVGPNFSALVTKDTNDVVTIQQTFGGPGIGSATISAIGHVGAAAVLGTSFPQNVGDQVAVSGGNSGAAANSASGSAAQSSSSSAASGSGSATGGTGGQHIPPGHIDNPSQGNPGHSKP